MPTNQTTKPAPACAVPVPETEAERLRELEASDILDTLPEPAFDRITRMAAHVLHAPIAVVNFIAADRQWFKSCVGLDVNETSRDVSLCAWAILTPDLLVVPDLREDSRFVSNPFVLAENGLRFYAGAPLVTAKGHILGTLCVLDTRPRPAGLSAAERQTLEDLAALVMDALELRINSRHVQLIMDSVPALLSYVDTDCRYRRANSAYAQWFGKNPDEMRGLHIRDVLGDEYFSKVQPYVQAVLRGETVVFETLAPGQTEERWLQGTFAPDLDASGRTRGFAVMASDITERRRAEEAIRRTNRELEEFAFVASHDLQEPLRMVNIYTDLLLKHLGPQQGKPEMFAAFVRQGVQRMEDLIRDLLSFSRTVHTETDHESVADLNEALADALKAIAIRVQESGARIEADPLPVVRGDATQYSHVFQNLLGNAIKYRQDEVSPEIRITAEPRGSEWVVSVRDNGIGFHPQYAERIFGLFKRLHKTEYPGTGLGLAICQRIVERAGGRMWAESHPGEGATFFFCVPAGTQKSVRQSDLN